ncbi:hypothetical protein [Tomitella gaofuii]|nr:hypothetical protein [Tomitella gaofuii]
MITGSANAIIDIAEGSAELGTGSGPTLGALTQRFFDALTTLSGGTPAK